ncbi:MAG: peroxiredoxin [Rickettsiaceae bacterium H1]|nr:peroxiredoxin [Rickettsiaceae bacterium H1]
MVGDSTLVCKHALDFSAKTIMSDGSISENFNFKEHVKGKYGVLFFYPLDFTFVCPTEIIAFSNRIEQFNELNTELIGVSVDSHFTHYAWRKTLRENGGIGDINFPLVADLSKSISKNYGVLLDESISLRGTFIIDRDFIIRHQSVNDLPLGRNIDELIRLIKALQYTEKHGEVCPAGWTDEKQAMKPDSEGVASYLAEYNEAL